MTDMSLTGLFGSDVMVVRKKPFIGVKSGINMTQDTFGFFPSSAKHGRMWGGGEEYKN